MRLQHAQIAIGAVAVPVQVLGGGLFQTELKAVITQIDGIRIALMLGKQDRITILLPQIGFEFFKCHLVRTPRYSAD